MQLCESGDNHANSNVVLVPNVDLSAELINDLVDLVLVWDFRRVLAHDPRDDLHQGLCDAWVLLEDFQVDLNGALSECFTLLGLLVLAQTRYELVRDVLSDQVTAHLEHLVHCANVPTLGRSKLLSEFVDLEYEVLPSCRLNRRCLQVAEQLVDDGLDVLCVGHLEKQVQRPYLEGVVGILQAVNDHVLVVKRVLRIYLHDLNQTHNAHVLQIL